MKEVALVLSSGGARGFAHIGAIEELEAQGYKITSIAGASMGALIGGFYAAGKLSELKERAYSLDIKKMLSLLDPSLSINHVIKGNKVMDALTEILQDINIEDLPIPFCAIATNLWDNTEIVFESGSLLEAIRASISIPSFFRPMKSEKQILIDGGVINPLPLNRVKRNGNDLLIAVNVSSHSLYNIEEERKKALDRYKKRSPYSLQRLVPNLSDDHNYFTLLSKTFSLMIQQNTALSIQLTPPDILTNIPMNRFGGFDYDKAEKIARAGKLEMRKSLLEFNNSK